MTAMKNNLASLATRFRKNFWNLKPIQRVGIYALLSLIVLSVLCEGFVAISTATADTDVNLETKVDVPLIDDLSISKEMRAKLDALQRDGLYTPGEKAISALRYYEAYYTLVEESKSDLSATGFSFVGMITGDDPDGNFVMLISDIFNWKDFKIDNNDFSAFTACESIYNAMTVIGILLMLIYWIVDILEKVTMDNFNLEHLFRKLLSLAIGIVVLMNGFTIMMDVIKTAEAIRDAFVTAYSTSGLSSYGQAKFMDLWASHDSWIEAFGTGIGMVVAQLLGYVIMFLCLLIIYVTAFGTKIELMTRLLASPIALANISHTGPHAGSVMYIKKFFAVALKGFIITAMLCAYAVVKSVCSGLMATGLGYIVIGISLIGCILKADGIANDVVGVH